MTESPTRSAAAARERPGGYRRSPSGLVGAMVATVVAVLAFVGLRGLFSDDAETPVPTVDWTISLKAARADGQLEVLAPARLPSGWRATSASYTPGAEPAWHLGMLTSGTRYVGVEEARVDLETLVRRHVDEDARRGAEVTIGGTTWRVFTDTGGDYALGRTVESGGRAVEAQLVVGAASPATIRAFTASLHGR